MEELGAGLFALVQLFLWGVWDVWGGAEVGGWWATGEGDVCLWKSEFPPVILAVFQLTTALINRGQTSATPLITSHLEEGLSIYHLLSRTAHVSHDGPLQCAPTWWNVEI